MTFEESGMEFTFDDDKCYRIEKDKDVTDLQGVKNCECVALVDDMVYFVEAKLSKPECKEYDFSKFSYDGRPLDPGMRIRPYLKVYSEMISQKFQDSFSFIKASLEGRHGEEKRVFAKSFIRSLNLDKIRFVLVVNNEDEDGNNNLNNEIKEVMRHFLNSWNIPDRSVKVVNPGKAELLNLKVRRRKG